MGLKSLIRKLDPGKTRSSWLPGQLNQVLPAALFLGLITAAALPALAQPRAAGRLLVQPRSRLSETDFDHRLTARGARQARKLGHSNVRVVTVSEALLPAVLATLRSDPEIEFVEPDYVATSAFVPNDPRVQSGEAWHLMQMQATSGWDYAVGNSGVIVAVLDSGVDATHPDLQGQLLAGYDFVNGDGDPDDDFGHGTAVTGAIVASGNNGVGVAGVAFGCRVLPVKVMGATGYAYYSGIAEGIHFAVDQGARVINISIAGDSPSETLQSAIDYAWSHNVLVVVAAGNTGNSTPQYPAACEHTLTVGATESTDLLAGFSSYGSHVQLTAPGVGIWTTQRSADNPFGTWRGTSFASPLVAGAAALLVSVQPNLSPAAITELLEQSAEDLGPVGRDEVYGYGRLNILRALTAAGAQPMPPPVATTPPQVRLTSPGPDQSGRVGQRILLEAAVSSGTAPVTLVEFFANDTKLAGLTGPPYELPWSPPQPGDYQLRVVVTDAEGQRGTSESVTLRVAPTTATATVQLTVVGAGSVTPNLDGRPLVIGKTYTVRAKPGRDQLFAGWEGLESEGAVLTFVMREGLELTAHFVPSPFLEVQGTFYGLAANADRVAPESSAAFTLTLSRMGAFSGKLQLEGKTHSFRGQFDLAGQATVTINRPLTSPVALALTLDLATGGTLISGDLNGGGWASTLRANRNVFSRSLNPAPQAGKVAFALAAGSAVTETVATGANRIAMSGASRVSGRLADGRKFARAASLARDGDFPFYLARDRGAEVVIGWVNFPAQTLTAANGTVVWARGGTNAFATTLQATGGSVN